MAHAPAAFAQTLDQHWAHCENIEETYSKDQEISGCTAIIESSASTSEDRITAYFNRGMSYHNSGKFQLSIDDNNALLKLAPDDADAIGNRGLSYASMRDYDRAIADYNAALALRADAIDYGNRATAYYFKQNLSAALADYDAAVRLKADDAFALYGRGIVKLRLGQTAAGQADLAAATAIDPTIAGRFAKSGMAP
jgi:tetratricopeptide (TPR) repeat protein